MAGNIFISLLLASMIQYLWSMINSLQIIVLGVLLDCLQPPNAKVIQFEILKACAFDFFRTETIYRAIFDFGDSESFSDAFDEAEIQGSIFIIGIGPVFLIFAIYIVYFLVHTLFKCLFKGGQNRCNCMNKFIQPKNYTNIFIIFLLEGCIEIGTMCSVCFSKVS